MKQPIATVSRSLSGFEANSTQAYSRGKVPPGKYHVLAYHPTLHSPDTDFAQIECASYPGGKTWVCTRWKYNRYATITDQEGLTLGPFGTQHPKAMAEGALLIATGMYEGYGYSWDKPSYPVSLPGVSIAAGTPKKANCCTFAERVLVSALHMEGLISSWSYEDHANMMIAGKAPDLFGPVNTMVKHQFAQEVPTKHLHPMPWTLVQGWQNIHQLKGGHTFFILGHYVATDKVLTLEATSQPKVNGVGHKGIGRMEVNHGKLVIPPRWWEGKAVPTWKELRERFPDMAAAVLHMKM